jgi:anaerobic selenocysteine-containing dehydrogenase
MPPETRHSFCRFCHAFCPIKVDVDTETNEVLKVVGDPANPLYAGYTCIKGRAIPEQHRHPGRLLHSMARVRTVGGAQHHPVSFEQAAEAIAERLRAIIDEHGPRAVAMYSGNASSNSLLNTHIGLSFMRAIQSPMRFYSATIDSPGKPIARALHGGWSAGAQSFLDADTWMIIGANPLVSMWGGIPTFNPGKHLREARERGLKLIVIDPRRTETAAFANVFLQPRPGEDPTVLAGLLRVIIEETLYDADFVADETEGFEALRAAVQPFTPAYVERRADVPADDIVLAARTFATAERGSVTAGTGANMAPRGTLMEYLVGCLQSTCGRWLRAGEPVPNPYVLLPPREFRAQAEQRRPAFGFGEKLRVRGLSETASGLSSAALAEEILLPGEGQVRALICFGGNPMMAWPDQEKTRAAMDQLELGVAIDIKMTATAQLCDYVIAAKLPLEMEALTVNNEILDQYGVTGIGYPAPYAQFADKVVDPPAGSDVVEEWQFFYAIAQRLGVQLKLRGERIDMEHQPEPRALWDMVCSGSRIPADEVRSHPEGRFFPTGDLKVLPKADGWTTKLDVGNELMMDELAEVAAEGPLDPDDPYPFRLITRRLREFYNSSGRDLAGLTKQGTHNPAYLHPADLEALGAESGDLVEITSAHGKIVGVAAADRTLRRGVVSMAHCFGDTDPDRRPREVGSNTNRLIAVDAYDALSGLPRLSAVPVRLRTVRDEPVERNPAGAW